MQGETRISGPIWPELRFEAWQETRATLHMWMQIVGKVRLVQGPPLNHSWHATYYVTSRGLTTSPIFHGARSFQVDFDFVEHRLSVYSSDGGVGGMNLAPRSVAEFYRVFFGELARLELPVRIYAKPNEVPDAIPFQEDTVHRAYDPDSVQRFWRILVQADRLLKQFRSRFLGKCSPVHFFWGAQDLAVTRFSGRRAPEHPGGVPNLPDRVTREAYSHEVSSAGFWPGSDGPVAYPAFYSYAYPEPPGYGDAPAGPAGAFYSKELKEFILPYEVVRTSSTPDATVLEFLQATYDAAARLGAWDRAALEWSGT